MERSLTVLMTQLALYGIDHHCHEEALRIADWLEQVEQQAEAACLIRVNSLMGQGRCQDVLLLSKDIPWESISPWLALCERHLGLGAALDRRLDALAASTDPALVRFAQEMRT